MTHMLSTKMFRRAILFAVLGISTVGVLGVNPSVASATSTGPSSQPSDPLPPAVPTKITITYFKRSAPAVTGCPTKAMVCPARHGSLPSRLIEFYTETFGSLRPNGTRPVAVALLLPEGTTLHTFTATGLSSSNLSQIHSNDSWVMKAAQSTGVAATQMKGIAEAGLQAYSASGEYGFTDSVSYSPNYTLNNYINWCWGGGTPGVHWGYVYNCGWWPGSGTPPATNVWASYGWGSQWSCNPSENGYYFGWSNMNYSPNTGYYTQGTATCSSWMIPFYSRHPYVDEYVYADGEIGLGPTSP
jgi:hypothetical protein